MVYKLYRIASRIASLNALLKNTERKVLMNTFHKARSNSTVAWPPPKLLMNSFQRGRSYSVVSWPPPKLATNYQKFQMDNGLPVHLKGGFADRAVLGATVTMIALGLFDGLYTLLTMAFPQKKT